MDCISFSIDFLIGIIGGITSTAIYNNRAKIILKILPKRTNSNKFQVPPNAKKPPIILILDNLSNLLLIMVIVFEIWRLLILFTSNEVFDKFWLLKFSLMVFIIFLNLMLIVYFHLLNQIDKKSKF